MKILLDENVPDQIRPALTGHEVKTVRDMTWAGFVNGELLRLIEGDFDVFITADKNLKYQQNLSGRRIAILELSTNKRRIVEANLELIRETVNRLKAGDFVELLLAS